jgi:preprotein translocase subunit SecD
MTPLTKALAAAAVLWGCAAGTRAAPQPDRSGSGFEVRRAEDKPGEGLTEATVAGSARKVYLHREAALTGRDVTEARAIVDGTNGPAVEITLTEEGRKKLAKLTEGHQGKPLAILVNGKVLSAPVVRGTISQGKALISGRFTKAEAETIAKGIAGK